VATIDERYTKMFAESAKAYKKAVGYFPSGITHQNRYAEPFPVYFSRAMAGVKFDLDGNEIIDYVMGNGALLQGHAHPEIVAAVAAQTAQGTHLGGSTLFEIEWAEAVMRLAPSIEQVRFTNSGTESTYLAIRMARAFTGKNKILKFEEHYHGWHEWALPSQGNNPPAAVPQAIMDMVLVCRPNIDEVERILKSDKDVAAVILEPTGGHYSCFPIQCETFLPKLREVTARYGVLLIFDETITGFRVSKGGAQVRYNIDPDLSTFGKIVAGGMPGAAVGGRAEIMEMMAFRGTPDWDNVRRIGQGGTFNANPPTAIAGIVGLKMLAERPINQRADELASRLKKGINNAFRRAEVPGFAYGIASMVNPLLGMWPKDDNLEDPTISYEERRASMTSKRTGYLTKAMLTHGVHVMGGQVFMVSSAHTESQVDETVEAFEKSLRDLRNEGIV
jgi:glutamate-1-semialdehyde 2,1-aminomutase